MNSVRKIRQTKSCPDCVSDWSDIRNFFSLKDDETKKNDWSEKKEKRARECELVKMKHEVWRTAVLKSMHHVSFVMCFFPPSLTSFHYYFYSICCFCLRVFSWTIPHVYVNQYNKRDLLSTHTHYAIRCTSLSNTWPIRASFHLYLYVYEVANTWNANAISVLALNFKNRTTSKINEKKERRMRFMEHFAKILLGISANERTNEQKRRRERNNKITKQQNSN